MIVIFKNSVIHVDSSETSPANDIDRMNSTEPRTEMKLFTEFGCSKLFLYVILEMCYIVLWTNKQEKKM